MTANHPLHHEISGALYQRVLHFLQIVFHQVKAVHALFEVLREVGEQGRHLGVFEVLGFVYFFSIG